MKSLFLVFPHQLFENILPLKQATQVVIIEEYLFFQQYNFHKQKLFYHRASMKFYENYLQQNNIQALYINSFQKTSDIRFFLQETNLSEFDKIICWDCTDSWLEKRIKKHSPLPVEIIDSPYFVNSKKEIENYFEKKQRYFQTDFYIHQRKIKHILMDGNLPLGGKWSFDANNRDKWPKDLIAPTVPIPTENSFYNEAVTYVNQYFANNIGNLNSKLLYPCTFADARFWFQNFLINRFENFGKYEDAIVKEENILLHSLLSPMLNVGLLTPNYVVSHTLEYSQKNAIPINSVEGFIRQIIGWREFIRATYITKGNEERVKNFWQFKNPIPNAFYTASTGIEPFDHTINKVLKTGYCHHIERLMILGNFMLLCEINPDHVYQWFMELFIDAYDWVMVPNVYGMSQFADGGLFATKPYISGSNYILKMSNYKKGEWQPIWDGLFWRFMDKHRSFFSKNPRLNMLISSFDKMPVEKRTQHLIVAENFLQQLYSQ